MEKLLLCRICLVENVRMYAVVSKNMQDLYESLTHIPFVTEDSRPALACFFCYAKLKQCCQLQRQCREAEELFAQMMNEPNPSINRDQREFNVLVKTPVVNININCVGQTEYVAIKEELPVYYDGLEEPTKPKEEPHSDDNGCSDVDDTPLHHSESDVDITDFKSEVEEEEEVLRKKHRATDMEKICITTMSLTPDMDLTPDFMREEHKPVVENILPTKSMERYLKSYDDLMKWCAEKKVKSLSENVLLIYFNELSMTYKPSTLWSVYSMLKTTLRTKRNVHIKDFERLISFLKRQSDGFKSKKSKVFTSQEIETFLNQAPDEIYLVMKVVLILAISGACRSVELVNMKVDDIEKQGSSAAVKPKEDTRRKKLDDVIPEQQMKNKISETKIIQTTQSKAKERKGTFREPHKCDVCQSSFMRKRSLFKHIRTHTGETPYKCDICQRSFNKKTHLTNHIRTHTGEKPYKCDICQHSFSVQNALTLHIRTHTGEKPYKCDVCQRGFGRKGDLDRHSLTHTGEKPYKCDICQRSFNQKSNLLKHVRTHTGEERYKCDICQSTFSTRDNFRYHIRTHTVKKPFNCDICNLGCSSKNSLTLHIRTHTGEKPYKCDVCQRSFNRKDTLDRHFRTHNGEKPYKCSICERQFSIREHLVLHIRTHTGEKPYKCDICQRSFSSNHRLKLHIRTHTGEKPYKCDICQRSFRENGNLLKHIRTHTGVKQFIET